MGRPRRVFFLSNQMSANERERRGGGGGSIDRSIPSSASTGPILHPSPNLSDPDNPSQNTFIFTHFPPLTVPAVPLLCLVISVNRQVPSPHTLTKKKASLLTGQLHSRRFGERDSARPEPTRAQRAVKHEKRPKRPSPNLLLDKVLASGRLVMIAVVAAASCTTSTTRRPSMVVQFSPLCGRACFAFVLAPSQ